jgi:hypothetical protein
LLYLPVAGVKELAVGTFIYNAYRDYSSKLSALLLDPVFQGEGIRKGEGEAILLIPGFTAGDWTVAMATADWVSHPPLGNQRQCRMPAAQG